MHQTMLSYGGSSFVPSDLGSYHLHYDGNIGINLVGSNVNSWEDQGINSRDVTAPGSGNRPLYVTNHLNGNNVLYFNGSSSYLQFATFAQVLPTINTHYIVFKLDGNQSSKYILDSNFGAGGSRQTFGIDGSGNDWELRRALAATGGLPTADTWLLAKIEHRSGNIVHLNINSGGGFTSGDLGSAVCNGFSIGSRYQNGPFYFKGWIAEILAYSEVLSPANDALVNGYLNTKFGF